MSFHLYWCNTAKHSRHLARGLRVQKSFIYFVYRRRNFVFPLFRYSRKKLEVHLTILVSKHRKKSKADHSSDKSEEIVVAKKALTFEPGSTLHWNVQYIIAPP